MMWAASTLEALAEMQFDDDKDQGGAEPRPDGPAAGPSGTPDSATNAPTGGPAGAATPDFSAAPDQSAPPQPPPPASPWQPIQPVQPTGWVTPSQQPQWGAPQWGAPPAPSLQSQWPPQQPPAPPAWPPASPSWPPQQPQANWGMPPAPRPAGRPTRLPIVIGVVAACLLAFSGGLLADHYGFAPSSTQGGNGGQGPIASAQSAALYNEALQIVKQNFVGRKSLTDQQLTYGSIAGLVNSLGDTGHSEFLTAADYAAMQSQLNTSSIAGIGVVLSDDSGAFKVTRVLSGTPAAQAGVRAGDQITAVGGTSTANMSFNDLTAAVRGDPGTAVTITVIHLGSSTPVDITMTRAKITVPLSVWGMVPGTHVADISLAEFSTGAADQVQTDITAAQAAGATSIVLDLRGNPGGYADEAREVASEFLPSGTVYIQQDSSGNETKYTVDMSRSHTALPLVVLVDHDSASSSEIVTGALQDSGRATVVGINTFGTGTVLQPFQLSDGSVIILGTAWWLTPDGHRIFGVGITPDQKVQMQGTAVPTDPQDLSAMTASQFDSSTDAQLLAAVADLNK
jgi:carboxyl-terminal processing protease